jgi:hypothetical protein
MREQVDIQLLEDVRDALLGLLVKIKGPLPANCEIVRDYDRAVELIMNPPDAASDSWYDLRQWHVPGITLYAINQYILDKQLFPDRICSEYADEVYVDACIMYSFLKHGQKLDRSYLLFNSIYKAYSAGAWPCGWSGNYPEGHLIVYWPFKEEPTFEPL